MTSKPSVLIPIAPGTNRNDELAEAFELAGAAVAQVPLLALRQGEVKLADHQILGLAGGFSYGDALGAGRLFGLDLVTWFNDQVAEAVARGMPVIGICNGFQALVRAGLLPGRVRAPAMAASSVTEGSPSARRTETGAVGPPVALVANESGRFECRWVTLRVEHERPSVWLDPLTEPLRCPIAHGEGRLAAAAGVDLAPAVAFRYATADGEPARGVHPANPNGSVDDIAGLVDPSGLVLGLMPHPEDHIHPAQDPLRGRGRGGGCRPLFAAGVAAVA